MGKYFETDGVRGQANMGLNLDMAIKIGQYLGWFYSQSKQHARILIGQDTRLSGDMFVMGLAAGAASTGANVDLLGVCPTPAVSWFVSHMDFDCGIMVSASHNPFEDNGIKVFNHEGVKMEEEILLQVEACMDGEISVPLAVGDKIGTVKNAHYLLEDYIHWLQETVPMDLTGMDIAVDLANGSAISTAKETLEGLGANVHVLHGEADGLNINLHAGSTHPERLQNYVKDNHMDLGLAFDGDADRLIAVNSQGELVNGDYLLYILGRHMKANGKLPHNMVVTTVMANLGLYKALEASGIDTIQTPVGDKYVFEEMQKNGYGVGGEQSGHIIFLEHEVTGDGLMTALKLLQAVKESGKTIEELSEGLYIYPQLLENVRVTDKNIVLNDPEIKAAIQAAGDALGSDGRILVRPSGTEPLIRVMVEAGTDELCEKYVHSVTNLIREKGYAA